MTRPRSFTDLTAYRNPSALRWNRVLGLSCFVALFALSACCTWPSAPPSPTKIKVQPIAVTASNWIGSPPPLVADGDPSTIWNSGSGPTQWVQFNLGKTVAIGTIRLKTHQDSEDLEHTTHRVWVGQDPSSLRLVKTFSQYSLDCQWLEHNLDGGISQDSGNVRYVRITTTVKSVRGCLAGN